MSRMKHSKNLFFFKHKGHNHDVLNWEFFFFLNIIVIMEGETIKSIYYETNGKLVYMIC